MMRRRDKAMAADEAADFLSSNSTGVLSLVDGNGPYAIPIHYTYDAKTNAAYFHCATEGRKLDILRKNPNACLTVFEESGLKASDNPCRTGTLYGSVIAEGRIEEVSDPQEKIHALEALVHAKSGKKSHIPEDAARSVTVLRMRLGSMSGKKDAG
jgi:uncharacterized protein